jgi:tetraacyldisaccharide 4'-kinase
LAEVFILFLHFAVRVLAFPLLVVYFLLRGLREPRYFPTLPERLGFLPGRMRRAASETIWLHAVSVGEVLSSIRLIEELRKRQPGIGVFVSTTTLAGHDLAVKRLQGLVRAVFYAPIDYAFVVRRVLRRLRPVAVIVLETEIWPVLFREVHRAGCALVVVNGRISDRTVSRYQRWRFFFRPTLALPHTILAQSDRDLGRYFSIGAPPENLRMIGNLKYDTAATPPAPASDIAALLQRLEPKDVWIAASTMPGFDADDIDEDDVVIASFEELRRVRTGLLLILAPRRPERFGLVGERLAARGIPHLLRSRLKANSTMALPGVFLLDTIGELAGLFALADIVFMGGTLARRGGHNLLEPSVLAKPIVSGPHLENFTEMAVDFRNAGALAEIAGPAELASTVESLLNDPDRRKMLGAGAQALAAAKQGVAKNIAAEVFQALDQALPLWPERGPAFPILWALSRLWIWGTNVRSRRETRRSLSTPVVSLGGLAMGGVGKTPLCAHIAESLVKRGYNPAILTRGYRRRSLEQSIILEAGAHAPARMTGDEAQILVRFAHAHVGIGADRWQTGRRVEERLHPNIFLLDDGFQHTRLHRNLDVVLIDALDPFPGNAVFPLGKLREPLTALSRAGCFVITRAQPNRRYDGVRRVLARYNPNAPVFLARVEARSWIDERGGEPAALPDTPFVAFCGLGNPDTFWRTLDKLEIQPVFRWTFGDHHAYLPRELHRLAQQARTLGASALLTTEKDAMNLPTNALDIIAPLDLYWLKIDVYLEQEPEFLAFIESHARA